MFCPLLNSQCLEQCSVYSSCSGKCLWNECTEWVSLLVLLRVVQNERQGEGKTRRNKKWIRMPTFSSSWGMDKEGMIYLYNEILLSHTKEQSWVIFVETWMDLETVIWTEVSQKEKNKYRINMDCMYMETEKIGRWPYLQSRNRTRVEKKYVWILRKKAGVEWIRRLGLAYMHY